MTSTVSTDVDYLAIANQLSPAPRILPRLLALLSDPDSDINEMVDLISFDPGLTSKLLRACNSAFVGLPEPAGDVGEAVNRLGVNFVYQMAAAVCGGSAYQSRNRADLTSLLWQHSVTSAFAAELVATDIGLARGTLFTAALLHDIGKLVLGQKWQLNYWELLDQARNTPGKLVELEQANYDLNHGELGGRVLSHWKFPTPIVSAVWQHTTPRPGIPFEKETACVTLAEAIAEALDSSGAAQPLQLTEGRLAALEALEFKPQLLEVYLNRTQENFQFVNAMCQLNS